MTILAGATTAFIDVDVIDDLAVEALETVIVTLSAVTAGHPAISIGAASSATVDVTSDDFNTAPVGNNDAYAMAEDGVLNVAAAAGVLANDTDAELNPLTAVLVAGPANGTLTLNADGSFVYAPTANFNGADSFTYRANDGSLASGLVTVTIGIAAVNDDPALGSNAFTITNGGTLAVNGEQPERDRRRRRSPTRSCSPSAASATAPSCSSRRARP